MKINFEFVSFKENLPINMLVHSVGDHQFHWHKEIEIIVVLNGSISVVIEETVYELNEDDILLINANQAHSTYSADDENIILAIQLDKEFCQTSVEDFANYFFTNKPKTGDQCEEILMAFSKIMLALNKKITGYRPMVLGYVNIIISNLLCLFDYEISYTQPSISTNDLKTINDILAYIDDNYKERITLSSVAKLFGYSHFYISHFFKAKIGVTFQDYVTKIRLKNSALELISTKKSVSDISLSNGFSNIKSFNSYFKRRYEMSPLKYRQCKAKFYENADKQHNGYLSFNKDIAIAKIIKYDKINTKELSKKEQIVKSVLNINLENPTKRYNKYWQELTTFGRAYDILRADVQEQLKMMQVKLILITCDFMEFSATKCESSIRLQKTNCALILRMLTRFSIFY